MIERPLDMAWLTKALTGFPIVGILGARQVGKTTLARELARRSHRPSTFFDLERADDLAALADPLGALERLKGLVVLDEIQRLPEVFPVLRVLADRPRKPAKFLVLGSASPDMLRQTSETLAGRIHYHELSGLSLADVGAARLERLWSRGGFPRSYVVRSDAGSFSWRTDFIRTFIERDLPQLGVNVAGATMFRFWSMLAHWHGQVWNASELARSFGVSEFAVRSYLDKLTSALVVRQLQPWHENLAKRQVKAPKLFITDSGLLHGLLNIRNLDDLLRHPKLGTSWEGFIIDQCIRRLGVEWRECFFWGTHAGAELDLLVVRGNSRLGFEIKRTSAPQATPSMRIAMDDLKLDRLFVMHAGRHSFDMGPKIRAIAASAMLDELQPL